MVVRSVSVNSMTGIPNTDSTYCLLSPKYNNSRFSCSCLHFVYSETPRVATAIAAAKVIPATTSFKSQLHAALIFFIIEAVM